MKSIFASNLPAFPGNPWDPLSPAGPIIPAGPGNPGYKVTHYVFIVNQFLFQVCQCFDDNKCKKRIT